MKSLTFIALLLSLSTIIHGQENYDASVIAPALKSRANAVIRNEQTFVDMQTPTDVSYRVKKAITILNKNGEDHARLMLFYDKSTVIKSVKGEVFDEFGKLRGKLSLSDFRDESAISGFSLFEDSRIKHYFPSVNTFPYTVVYTYEIRHKQNLIIPDWTPKPADDVAVENSTYTFICKPEDKVNIQAKFYPGKVLENSSDKQKTMIWEVKNVPAIKAEPYRPNYDHYLTQVKIAPEQFSYFNYKGNYTNWNDLGRWYNEVLLKKRDDLPLATIEIVKTLTANEKSEKDKAKKIYEYLQEKTRYISVQIGIGGFQPIKATDVDRLGYGDCKGLVNYMQAMLKVVNIESYYCVVQAGPSKISMDPSYANMTQGNHVILCLPLKNDTTWLECTSQTTPFGYLGDFTDDRYVLAVTPEGGKIMKTPSYPTKQNIQNRYAKLKLSENGAVEGDVITTFAGTQYENHEHIAGKSTTEQIRQLKSAYDVDQIDFSQVSYSKQKTVMPTLTEKLHVEIPKYASLNGNKLFLQLNVFNIQPSIAEAKNRQMPIQLNRGYTDIDTLVYELPEHAALLSSPENKKFQSDFGEYSVEMKLEGRQLTYVRKFVLNSGTFPAESYEKFAQMMSSVRSMDHLKLAISLGK